MVRPRRERNIIQMETLKNVVTKMGKLTDLGRKYSQMVTGLRVSTRTGTGMGKVQNILRTEIGLKESTWMELQREKGRCIIQMELPNHRYMVDYHHLKYIFQ